MDDELHSEIITRVDELIESRDHKGLVDLLKCFDRMYYYHTDAKNPGIPDAVYDNIVLRHDEEFADEYGTYASIQGVGAAPVSGADVRKDYKLPYYMGTVRKVLAELIDQKATKNWPCGKTRWIDEIQQRGFERYKRDTLTEYGKDPKKEKIYTLEGKADGISALLVYTKDGKKISRDLYTRGSGTTGKKLTRYLTARSHKDRFSNIPQGKRFTEWDDGKIVLRGELVMPFQIWKDNYQKEGYKNPRNIVSAIVNKVEKKKAKVEVSPSDIHFIAYELIAPRIYTRYEQIQQLSRMGFNTVPTVRCTFKKLTQRYLWNLFCQWREKTPYELDGVVVFMDWGVRPVSNQEVDSSAIAYKCNDQQAVVTVIGVEWTPASNGALKPTVFYEKAILGRIMPNGEIIGTENVAATAHNAAFVRDNKIGPGAKIRISRQGLTIPSVMDVIKPAKKADMPDHVAGPLPTGRANRDYPGHKKYAYEWGDGSSVAGRRRSQFDIFATEEQDETKIRLIEKFFRIPRKESTGMGIKGLGAKTVAKMYEQGYNTLTKVILLIKGPVKKFGEVIGSQANAQTIHDRLQAILYDNPVDLAQIMGASQIFPNARMKTVRKILTVYPDILTNPVEDLGPVPGVAGDVIETFPVYLPKFKKFLADTGIIATVDANEEEEVSNALEGENIMFTGSFAAIDPKTGKTMKRGDVQKLAKKYGGKIASGSKITSKVTLLVVGDAKPGGKKEQDARDKGVPVMSETDFFNKYIDPGEFQFS